MNDWRKAFYVSLGLTPLVLSLTDRLAQSQAEVTGALTLIFVGALPLLATFLFWSKEDYQSDPWIRYGKNRRGIARRALVKKSLILLVMAAGGSSLAQLHFYGASSNRLLLDLRLTLPVALAAALSVACFFACARSWLGKPGVLFALLASWLFTPHGVWWGASLPANHIRHLLSLGDPLPFPGWVSLTALYVMALVLFTLHILRVPR